LTPVLDKFVNYGRVVGLRSHLTYGKVRGKTIFCAKWKKKKSKEYKRAKGKGLKKRGLYATETWTSLVRVGIKRSEGEKVGEKQFPLQTG